jgi:hypothetical protein
MMQSYYSIDLCEEATAVLEDVPESRTIGEDDMQLEVMI